MRNLFIYDVRFTIYDLIPHSSLTTSILLTLGILKAAAFVCTRLIAKFLILHSSFFIAKGRRQHI